MPRGWLRSRWAKQCPQCNATIEIGDLVFPIRNIDNNDGQSENATGPQFNYVHLECAKKMDAQTNGTIEDTPDDVNESSLKVDVLCKHFARGNCLFGNDCLFSHDTTTANVGRNTTKQSLEKSSKMESDLGIEALIAPAKKRSGYATRTRVKNRFRAGMFRRWLLDTFGRNLLSSGSGILDVAGGNKAEIAFEFLNLNNIPATVIEPRALDLTKPATWLKLGIYHDNPIFQHYIDIEFDTSIVAKAPKHLRVTITPELCFVATGNIDSWPRRCSQALLEDIAMDNLSINSDTSSSDDGGDGAAENVAVVESNGTVGDNNRNQQQPLWERAWSRSVADARSRLWTTKGLTIHEESDTPSSITDNTTTNNNNSSNNNAPSSESNKAVPPPVEEVEDAAIAWQLLTDCSVVVAMHADQATEFAVDLALRHNKPFAVVPCCVYSHEFPRRRLNGKMVTTYEEFVEYLKGKHPDCKVAELTSFQGKNLVVYKL